MFDSKSYRLSWWSVGIVCLALAGHGGVAAAAQDGAGPQVLRSQRFVPDLAAIKGLGLGASMSPESPTPSGRAAVASNVLHLDLFSDTRVDVEIERREQAGPGQIAIVGRIAGDPLGVAYLALDGDTLAADIILHDARYEVRLAADGRHVVRQVDPDAVLDCATDHDARLASATVRQPAIVVSAASAVNSSAPAVVDLLVVYTPAAEAGAGGAAGMRSTIALAVTQTNDALQRSGVAHRFRLVHMARTQYAESGLLNQDLSRLVRRGDGEMEEVFDLRESVRADVVSLIVEASDHSGMAMTMYRFDQDTAATPLWNTVVRASISNSLRHELGHNAGLLHDRDNADGAQAVLPYAYGYRVDGRWATIMANSNCPGGPCPRIPYYSNPQVSYQGLATGVADFADEARALDQTMPILAGQRASCVTAVTPSPAMPARGGTASVAVTAAAGCTWNVDPLPAGTTWLTQASLPSGMGSGTVQYTVQPNPADAARTATISVSGTPVVIEQTGCAVTPALPTEFPFSGGPVAIAINAAATCAWQGTTFMNAAPVQQGIVVGSGTLQLEVARNDFPFTRQVTFSLNGHAIAVTQAARSVAPPTTPPASTLAFKNYLAEGATGTFFSTRLALFNPNAAATETVLRFLRDDGGVVTHALMIPAWGRLTILPESIDGLEAATFSTVIESSAPIVVDRTMTWDKAGRYGSHAETALAAPSTTWYLAEGSTSGEFFLFYLLQNPNPAPVVATIRYLRPGGLPPIEQQRTLPPNSRTTIAVDDQGPELASTDLSAVITASAPIIVERSMYLNRPGEDGSGSPFTAGHESAGITAPATHWFLAEGATGPFFDLFILFANPEARDALVNVDYLLLDGQTFSKRYTVPANSRMTVAVDAEDIPGVPGKPLSNVAVSSDITSTNGVPILVERTMWWPSAEMGPHYWTEAHNSPGARETGTSWALAEGEAGGPDNAETYILIANTSAEDGDVRVTLYFEGGGTVERIYAVRGRSRSTVAVSADFPAAAGRRFGALVESLRGPSGAAAQIVVERAMYTSPGGHTWTAGTNALATRLQ